MSNYAVCSAKTDEIQNIYWRAEQTYRQMSKVISIAIVLYDQSTYWLTFVYSFCFILTGNLDASTWPVIFELSVPFDTKTIFGWYLQLLITTCLDLAYIMCMLFGTTQFIGSCIHIMAMCEHFDLIMQKIQVKIEKNLRESNSRKFIVTRAKIDDQIRDAIQMHVNIYK